MSTPDFSTAENNQELANEVSCLKAMLTLMLQAMGQADAGRVIIKMEKQISQMEDEAQAAVFSSTVKQIKQALSAVILCRLKVSLTAGITSDTQNGRRIQISPVATA